MGDLEVEHVDGEDVRLRAFEISQGPGAGAAEENWLRAEQELRVVHGYDTVDRDLERLGLTVSRLPVEAAIHGLRIALKRARYAAELAAPQGQAGRRFLADAKVLQDLLGEHQDAVIAERRLRAATVVDARTAAAFVAGRIAERQRTRRARVTERLPAVWKRLRKSGTRLG